MRIMVATDAWKPQVNGVVRSLELVARALREFDAELEFLTPQGFATVPLPTYGEIRLALASPRAVTKRLDSIRFDHIHIATEGPIGLAARRYCLRRKRPFTTSYHTRFPEYISARTKIPEVLHLRAAAPFSQRGLRRDGLHGVDRRRPEQTWVSTLDALVARRGSPAVFTGQGRSL